MKIVEQLKNIEWKKVWESLKKPNGKLLAWLYPLTILFCVAAIVVASVDATAVWTYPVYAFAAILLFYAVYTLVRVAPTIKAWGKELVKRWRFTARYLSDYDFRTIVNAVTALTFNGAYFIFLGVMGVLFRSVWYGGLALYYIVLTFAQGGVLFGAYRDNKKYRHNYQKLMERRIRSYTNSGWALVAVAQVVAASLTQLVWSGWSFHYADLMIFAFAAFAFVKIGMAIYNLFKVTKRKGVVTKAVRHINLASAMVSILALQTALFDAFGEGGDFRLFNALTGVGCFILITILGAHTILDGRKRKKKLKELGDQNGRTEQ